MYWKHGGFVRPNWTYFSISMFQYKEIDKSVCINHSNFWISFFKYTEIQKFPCIETRRSQIFRVLYTEIFFKRQISEIATDEENILGCESGDLVLPIYEKNRVQKSHATVPLRALADLRWFANWNYSVCFIGSCDSPQCRLHRECRIHC